MFGKHLEPRSGSLSQSCNLSEAQMKETTQQVIHKHPAYDI